MDLDVVDTPLGDASPQALDESSFLVRGGETGALIAGRDWSATSLGPIEAWPQSLKTTLGLLLHSPVPIVLLWGPDGVMLYNDAYSVFAGGRHPDLLGSKVREGWPEVADFNDNVMKVGLAGGTLHFKDQELTLYRHGGPEQVWMDLDYSPVFGEDGRPHGVIAIVVETTERVRVEREQADQRQRLERMFEQAPAAIAMLEGPEHVVVLSNAAHRRLIGRDDVLGKPIREAEPGLAGQGVYEILDEVYETGEPFIGRGTPITFAFAGQAPQTRILDFLIEPVRSADGEIIGLFALALDMTERVRSEDRLAQSEARLELATRASGVGIWDWNLETGEVVFTSRAREIWGFAEDQVVTQALMARAMPPDDLAETNERFRRATDPAIRDRSPYHYRIRRPDGAERWVRAFAEAVFEVRDGREVAVRYVGTMADVTQELARTEALRSSEGRLKLAIEAGRMAVWSVGAEGALQVTPELNRLLGLPEDARPSLEELRASYYPGELERMNELVARSVARGERYIELEYRHLWPDGAVRWLLVRAELLISGEGRPQGAIGVAMDITQRREGEERLRLLAREVDHRANNLLAIVQGAISLARAADVGEYRESLLGRVAALANAHQLLSQSRWEGADLRRLVEEELRPFASEGRKRVRISGVSRNLPPDTAQGLAMVLHELATNAVKYGALSVPAGRVSVSWRTNPKARRLVVRWREEAGPPVVAPGQKGLGSRVLERALGGAIGGRTELAWRPDGLQCLIHLPVERP